MSFEKKLIERLKLTEMKGDNCPDAPPGHVFIGEFDDDVLGCICLYRRTEPPPGLLIIPCDD